MCCLLRCKCDNHFYEIEKCLSIAFYLFNWIFAIWTLFQTTRLFSNSLLDLFISKCKLDVCEIRHIVEHTVREVISKNYKSKDKSSKHSKDNNYHKPIKKSDVGCTRSLPAKTKSGHKKELLWSTDSNSKSKTIPSDDSFIGTTDLDVIRQNKDSKPINRCHEKNKSSLKKHEKPLNRCRKKSKSPITKKNKKQSLCRAKYSEMVEMDNDKHHKTNFDGEQAIISKRLSKPIPICHESYSRPQNNLIKTSTQIDTEVNERERQCCVLSLDPDQDERETKICAMYQQNMNTIENNRNMSYTDSVASCLPLLKRVHSKKDKPKESLHEMVPIWIKTRKIGYAIVRPKNRILL
ncbi:uncharacterized protein LOC126899572 [Daktulosphaira vitifoliae]|uniref:uncharacterized protein LOC126899572 n=1 Tax=Daktulosphaira vitifoliae TaxID=58002 RepID=UPI0021AA9587|nr:uncharacterized protein LOC126899572 [Daktulosphaira vitifoliae]